MRRLALERTAAPTPRLHSNIAEAYRRKVPKLHSAPNGGPGEGALFATLFEAIV